MEIGRWFMFESLGPAVPGSLVMEDRKADFLPYLSWKAQRSWVSFLEGHPVLGDVLGCREYQASSRSPAPALWGTAGLARGDGLSQVLCPALHHQEQVQWRTWGIKARSFWTTASRCHQGPWGGSWQALCLHRGVLSLGNMVRNQTHVFVHSLRR